MIYVGVNYVYINRVNVNHIDVFKTLYLNHFILIQLKFNHLKN